MYREKVITLVVHFIFVLFIIVNKKKKKNYIYTYVYACVYNGTKKILTEEMFISYRIYHNIDIEFDIISIK